MILFWSRAHVDTVYPCGLLLSSILLQDCDCLNEALHLPQGCLFGSFGHCVKHIPNSWLNNNKWNTFNIILLSICRRVVAAIRAHYHLSRATESYSNYFGPTFLFPPAAGRIPPTFPQGEEEEEQKIRKRRRRKDGGGEGGSMIELCRSVSCAYLCIPIHLTACPTSCFCCCVFLYIRSFEVCGKRSGIESYINMRPPTRLGVGHAVCCRLKYLDFDSDIIQLTEFMG